VHFVASFLLSPASQTLKEVQLQNKAQEGKSVRCTPTLSTHLALSAIFRVVFSALRGRSACCELARMHLDTFLHCFRFHHSAFRHGLSSFSPLTLCRSLSFSLAHSLIHTVFLLPPEQVPPEHPQWMHVRDQRGASHERCAHGTVRGYHDRWALL
jgi:hypothetical protein